MRVALLQRITGADLGWEQGRAVSYPTDTQLEMADLADASTTYARRCFCEQILRTVMVVAGVRGRVRRSPHNRCTADIDQHCALRKRQIGHALAAVLSVVMPAVMY